MKRRLGFLGWIVSAAVLVGAIYAGAAILNFAWWGPGYPGARAPERVEKGPPASRRAPTRGSETLPQQPAGRRRSTFRP